MSMINNNDQDVAAYSDDEELTAKQLIAEHYELLSSVARQKRRRAQMNDTMLTSDILHEGYLKLDENKNWNSSDHFLKSATLAIRHVIVDSARKRLSQKRGGDIQKVTLEDSTALAPEFQETPEQVLAISSLLEKLAAENPRWMRIVDARYFSGMSEKETADLLKVSERTVRRDWKAARLWIAKELGVTEP